MMFKVFLLYIIASITVSFAIVYPNISSKPFKQQTTLGATKILQMEAPAVKKIIDSNHITNNTLTNELSNTEIIESYFNELDPQKILFTKEDVTRFNLKYPSLFKGLEKEDINMAYVGFDLFKTRTKEYQELTEEILNDIDNLDLEKEIGVLHPKRTLVESEEDLIKLQREVILYNIISSIISEDTIDTIKANTLLKHQRTNRRLNSFTSEEVLEIYLTSIIKLKDPHSAYYSNQSLQNLLINIRQSLVGIGVTFSDRNGPVEIMSIIPSGSASEEPKLIKGLYLREVDHVNIEDLPLKSIVSKIRGSEGEPVTLTFYSKTNPSEDIEVELIRKRIELSKDNSYYSLYNVDNTNIGYIKLHSFFSDTTHSSTKFVKEALTYFNNHNVEGVVLDLRDNPGGVLSEAVNIVGLFTSTSKLVGIKYSNGKVRDLYNPSSKVLFPKPVLTLTSSRSASASEIVSGALQDLKRTLVIGDDTTFGKGSGQEVIPNVLKFNPKSGGMKLTTIKYYLPSGRSIQGTGVISDLTIPTLRTLLFKDVSDSDLPHTLIADTIPPYTYNQHPTEYRFSITDIDNLNKYLYGYSENILSLKDYSSSIENLLNEDITISVSGLNQSKQTREDLLSSLAEEITSFKKPSIELLYTTKSEQEQEQKSSIDDLDPSLKIVAEQLQELDTWSKDLSIEILGKLLNDESNNLISTK